MMLQAFLKEHFDKRKRKNPRYSIRSFAKFLGVESSTLSKILKGSGLPEFKISFALETASSAIAL